MLADGLPGRNSPALKERSALSVAALCRSRTSRSASSPRARSCTADATHERRPGPQAGERSLPAPQRRLARYASWAVGSDGKGLSGHAAPCSPRSSEQPDLTLASRCASSRSGKSSTFTPKSYRPTHAKGKGVGWLEAGAGKSPSALPQL